MMNMRKELTSLALAAIFCALVVLASLIFVPSPANMLLEEPVILLEIDTGFVNEWGDPELLTVTAYSACIAIGAGLAVVSSAVISRLQGSSLAKGAATAALSGALALLGAHWLYCALQWGFIVHDFDGTLFFPLQFWKGCFTMYGAILGALLGGFISARMQKRPVARVMDMLIPGLLMLIIAGRLGEFYSCEGLGNDAATAAFGFLPFRKLDFYYDPKLAVNPYEALVAIAALVGTIVLLMLSSPAGRAAEFGLPVVSAWQIMLDSMRNDQLIKFGFVRLNMIAAAVVLAFILTTRIIRCVRQQQGWKPWNTVRIVLFALGCGVVIFIEFALGGKINFLANAGSLALYIVDIIAVIAIMLSVLISDGREKEAR